MAFELEHDQLLELTIRRLEALGIVYMLAGSWASSVYGEPRHTMDIDIVIDPKPGEIEPLCNAFPESENFFVSIEAARAAVRQRHQFNVVHPSSGGKIDFIVAGLDGWNRSQVKRKRRVFIYPDLEGNASSPEDVIIAKMQYYREGGSDKHINDTAKILDRGSYPIDVEYIAGWAKKMRLTDIWQTILQRVNDAKR